jgi:ATPase
MKEKIVPDTSILIDGKLSDLAEEGQLEGKQIIVSEFVVDELENQANSGRETGYQGIGEIKELRERSDGDYEVEFTGRKPTMEEIELARNGRIDALIRDIAEKNDATLYTGDVVQARMAEAKGVDVELFQEQSFPSFSLQEYFDDETMSVHLKEGARPKAKKGTPGSFGLQPIGDEVLTREEMNDLISETIEKAEFSDEGLLEMEKDGATVIQLAEYRIAITRPPFSEAMEITAVRPVADVSLDDYEMSDKLRERLDHQAEGILVAGAPGHGKSTFAQALAEHYEDMDRVVKTMENPRDLDVSPDITQYKGLEDSMENTGDFLLLVRPDFTVFDEVRKTSDFEVFSDMRMAGVGMIGIVHASEAVDAVQRLIGRVELGMIPQVCDTVVFIRNAEIAEVYKVEMTVKVPQGMTEEDLARPVIQISRFADDSPQYEIYTYGEETVVIPVTEEADRESGAQKLAKSQVKEALSKYASNPEINFKSNDSVEVFVDEDDISHLIGKGGENIDRIEQELGLSIDVEPRNATVKDEIPVGVDERGNSVVLEIGDQYSGEEVDVYSGEDFLFAATVGKNGDVSLTKQSEVAGKILSADKSGQLVVRV